MKDRKGTVRQHPKGMVAVCTADFDPDYPAKARWVMSDQAHGSWHASDIYVRDWEVYFRPEWKPPLGSMTYEIDVSMADGRRKTLVSKSANIIGTNNNLEVQLTDGNWVCYAAGTWLGFTAKPSEAE